MYVCAAASLLKSFSVCCCSCLFFIPLACTKKRIHCKLKQKIKIPFFFSHFELKTQQFHLPGFRIQTFCTVMSSVVEKPTSNTMGPKEVGTRLRHSHSSAESRKPVWKLNGAKVLIHEIIIFIIALQSMWIC